MNYFKKESAIPSKIAIAPHQIFEFLVISLYGNHFPTPYNENKLINRLKNQFNSE